MDTSSSGLSSMSVAAATTANRSDVLQRQQHGAALFSSLRGIRQAEAALQSAATVPSPAVVPAPNVVQAPTAATYAGGAAVSYAYPPVAVAEPVVTQTRPIQTTTYVQGGRI